MKMKIPPKRLFLNNYENREKTQETLKALYASLVAVRGTVQVQSAARLIFQYLSKTSPGAQISFSSCRLNPLRSDQAGLIVKMGTGRGINY